MKYRGTPIGGRPGSRTFCLIMVIESVTVCDRPQQDSYGEGVWLYSVTIPVMDPNRTFCLQLHTGKGVWLKSVDYTCDGPQQDILLDTGVHVVIALWFEGRASGQDGVEGQEFVGLDGSDPSLLQGPQPLGTCA